MGYTQNYCVAEEFDAEAFAKVATDFKKMVTVLKHLGVTLADEMGENYPTVSPTEISFNGLAKCGHVKHELGIAWPSKTASGASKNGIDAELVEIVNSVGFVGVKSDTRVCDGDCSHESFSLKQKYQIEYLQDNGTVHIMEPLTSENANSYNKIGKHIDSTKTAYKPYDLAVTTCLVIAKHHLGDDIIVESDGTIENWQEAMFLCEHFLGYGKEFSLDVARKDNADMSDDEIFTQKWQREHSNKKPY